MSQGVFEKQQPTLDRVVILGELQEVKKALAELTERTTKNEVEIGILRVGCEAMFHTLELNGFLVAGEAAKVQGSNLRSEPKTESSWDAEKIKWTTAQGTKGEYERSEDVDNLEFKKMLKDLAGHKGKLGRDGFFYWTFTNGAVVGRKRRNKA